MTCPEEGANEFEQVAEVYAGELAAGRKQEGAGDGENDGEDEEPVGLFAKEEEEQHRNKHDIQASDEARIAGGGVEHTGLLQGTSHEKEEAGDEHPLVLGFG